MPIADMAVTANEIRHVARSQTTDLGPDDRQLVLDVVEEWVVDHPDRAGVDPERLVADLRHGLGLPAAPAMEDGRRWTRLRWVLSGGAVVVLIAGALTLRWWLGYDDATPYVWGGGWNSPDMEMTTINGVTDRHEVVRCEPGTLEALIGVGVPQGEEAYLESVTVPLLDDVWPDLGRARRVATEVRTDMSIDPDIRRDFHGVQLPDGGADLLLVWEVTDCGRMDGLTIISDVEVTYRALGRTRHATLPLVQPLALTTTPLDEVKANYRPD